MKLLCGQAISHRWNEIIVLRLSVDYIPSFDDSELTFKVMGQKIMS